MKINPNTPEKYRHIDGTKISAITKLEVPIQKDTHIVHFIDGRFAWWKESNSVIEEIPKERWQGIVFGAKILDHSLSIYESIDDIPKAHYHYAINIETLQVVKL